MSQGQQTPNSKPSSLGTIIFRLLVVVVVIGGGLVALIYFGNH